MLQLIPVAIALAAIQAAEPSTAATPPVWGSVTLGAPREQIIAAYPKGGKTGYNPDGSIEIADVTIIDKCRAEVNIYFESGVVDRVMVAGDPSMGGRCSEKVLTGLASKYGEPLDSGRAGGSLLGREGKVFIWNRPDGITMRFKRYTNGFLGGGGLLKASWELTYSKLGTDLAL